MNNPIFIGRRGNIMANIRLMNLKTGESFILETANDTKDKDEFEAYNKCFDSSSVIQTEFFRAEPLFSIKNP